jgi:2-iminobutanoate/2-iminopropanoate deaminase
MNRTQKVLVMPRHDSNPSEPVSQQTGRRDFMEIAVAGAAGSILLAAGSVSASAQDQSSEIEALFPAGAPAAAPGYSPGIVASGTRAVFVSGQGPADLKADMETQMRQTFDRIGLVLKAAGADFKHVVMLRAYFVHMARDLPVYRKVRLDYLSEPYPASTAVGTTELAIPGQEIEVEAVAIVGTSK